MSVVILKTDGMAVKLTEAFPENKRTFDIHGFLVRFSKVSTQGNEVAYKFYQSLDFKEEDRIAYTMLEGYYIENEYLKYIQNIGNVKISDLVKYRFEELKAKVGESVTVKMVDLGEPYQYFYKIALHTFFVEKAADSNEAKHYLRAVYDDLDIVRYEIEIPNTDNKKQLDITPKNLATRYFYLKNFSNYVNGWSITTEYKRNIKRIATQIAFRVANIVDDVFPYITDLTRVDQDAELPDDPSVFSGLDNYQQIIFELKKSWGYYYSPGSPFKNKADFDPIFLGEPNYFEYEKYYESLTNFYYSVYKLRNKFGSMDKTTRISFLVEILPISALTALPLEIIKKRLLFNTTVRELEEASQRNLVKLIISFTKRTEPADVFLDFLLEKPDTKTTIFEVLYNLLTDARRERLPYVNWFVDEQTNRKYFAYAIYELWKVSKYNWDYYPPNTTPIAGQINPDSYDFGYQGASGELYDYGAGIFEFTSIDTLTAGIPFNTNVKFTSALNKGKVKVTKIIKKTNYIRSQMNGTLTESTEETVGNFHLYYPVLLLGYQPSLDLTAVIPERGTIPAFLFYFAQEYKKLADFDALIALSIHITTDVLLAYFVGGSSLLRDLNYLKYTRLGKALIGEGAVATEALIIWRSAEVTAQAVTLGIAELAALNQYLIDTTLDAKQKEFQTRIQHLVLVLIIISVGRAIYANAKATQQAGYILTDIEVLSSAVHGVPEGILNILRKLKGEVAVTTSIFTNELNVIKSQINQTVGISQDIVVGIENIINKYQFAFDEATRFKFWLNFKDLKINSWIKFSENEIYVQNWIKLTDKGILEARILEVVVDQSLTNFVIKCYEKTSVRSVFLTFNDTLKVRFLKYFRYTNDPDLESLNSYSYLLDIWKGHTSIEQILIGNNITDLIKLEKAKTFLKTGDDNAVANLYGLSLHPPKTLTNYPGVRYLSDESIPLSVYEEAAEIANLTDDISRLFANTGIPTRILGKAKENYWIKERLCLNEVKINGVKTKVLQRARFTKEKYDIIQWIKAVDGEFINDTYRTLEEFKLLIAHEYIEGQLIDKFGMNFRGMKDFSSTPINFGAHDISPVVFNGSYADFGRFPISSPPVPNMTTWDNLDDIVNWYKDFYKL